MELRPLLEGGGDSIEENDSLTYPRNEKRCQQNQKDVSNAESEKDLMEENISGESQLTLDLQHPENETGQRPPSLPAGKEYHLFICHSGKDEDAVDRMVRSLEAKGVKCMYAKRDFRYGVPIRKNIEEGLLASLKILVVLSPNLKESGWCEMEFEMAYVNYIENKNLGIIPVMVDDCEVPDSIRLMTYIDARNNIDVSDDIISQLQKANTRGTFNPAIPVQEDKRKKNGNAVVIQRYIREGNRQKGGVYCVTNNELKQLQKNELQVSSQILQEIADLLNFSFAIRYQHLGVGGYCCQLILFVIFLLALFTLFLLFVSLAFGFKPDQDAHPYLWFLAFFISGTVLINCWMLFCVRTFSSIYCQAETELRRRLWADIILPHHRTKKFIVLYIDYQVYIVRYDLGPCTSFIEEYIGKNTVDSSLKFPNESPEEAAERIVSCIIIGWSHCLLRQPSKVNRHNMIDCTKCLCQLFEELYANN